MGKREMIALLFFISGIGEGVISFIAFKLGDKKVAKRNFYWLIFDLVILILMCFGWTPP